MGASHGNYSRLMFNEQLRYVMRRVQQGIPWVDADDNDAQESHYTLMRRIEQLLGDGAVKDGFKCVGVGLDNDFHILGGDGTADGAGRFFLSGHRCLLYGATSYKNDGASEDGKSLHPRITAISYQSGPNQTILSDSAANWDTNEHVGKFVTPDITQPGSTFQVVSNTQTEMVLDGDATTVAQVGDHYRIELLTPSGSNRVDGVFLNVYLDEIDCEDDPNLRHNLSTQVCAQLRMKLVQNIYIKEGSEHFPDYVDSDGNQHYTFQIARIRRYDGQDPINPPDIDDLRPILSDGLTYLPDILARTGNLQPVPSDPLADTIDIKPGVWTVSDRSAIKQLSTRTTSGSFGPVSTSGNVRYDLVSIDDGGNIAIKTGSEVAGPGDPYVNAPSPDGDKLALAIIRVNETGGVQIDAEDITDVREFLNIGMAANALQNYFSALWLRPHAQASPDNSIRIESGRYVKSDRSGYAELASAASVGPFSAVTAAGHTRYDLVQISDSAILSIKQGSEVVGAGNPFTNAPAPDEDKLGIAIVRVNETVNPVIEAADVTDVREYFGVGGTGEMVKVTSSDTTKGYLQQKIVAGSNVSLSVLNSGGDEKLQISASGGGGGGSITLAKDEFTATAGQTTFGLSFTPTDDTTLVFSGNILMHYGASEDYTFSGTNIVFTSGRAAGEQITVLQLAPGAVGAIVDERQVAAAGQTVFNITAFTYNLGDNSLWVFVNGNRQTVTVDYTETNTSTVTFSTPMSGGEEVLFLKMVVGAGGGGGGGGLTWQIISSSTTAAPSNGYAIDASGGSVTLTLPGSPNLYDQVGFVDHTGSATTNTITINPNGGRIRGQTGNLIVDRNYSGGTLLYVGGSHGWVLINETAQSGLVPRGVEHVELTEFHADPTNPASDVTLWGLERAVRFGNSVDTATLVAFEKPSDWSGKDIKLDIRYAVPTNGGASQQVSLNLEYWKLTDGVKPNKASPDGTAEEEIDVSSAVADTSYHLAANNLVIPAADVQSGECRYLLRIWRDVNGVTTNYPAGFDLISVLAHT